MVYYLIYSTNNDTDYENHNFFVDVEDYQEGGVDVVDDDDGDDYGDDGVNDYGVEDDYDVDDDSQNDSWSNKEDEDNVHWKDCKM